MADYSLDERIRTNNVPKADMSLDEYIFMKNIGKPAQGYGNNRRDSHSSSGVSKFDRYKNQDEDMDDDDGEVTNEMPKLVPYEKDTMPAKRPIHHRLGDRSDSVCESIHTSRLNLASKQKFKAKNRISVQNRLGKNWKNPAILERNRITMHTINEISRKSNNMFLNDDDDAGKILLGAFARAVERDTSTPKVTQKYNMQLQKEISSLQGKPLYFACPGKFVISSDGPGVRGNCKVPTHTTEVSLNQRFA